MTDKNKPLKQDFKKVLSQNVIIMNKEEEREKIISDYEFKKYFYNSLDSYFCDKCEHRHSKGSGIFEKHKKGFFEKEVNKK